MSIIVRFVKNDTYFPAKLIDRTWGSGTASITVDAAGNAALIGANLTVNSNGFATLIGATLTVDAEGSAMVA